MSSQPSTMTKKDRIAEVGKGLRRSSTMKPCSKQAQLEQVAQDHVHLQFQISPGTETPQTFQVSCPSVWLHWPQWKGFFLCLNVIFSIWVQWLSPVLLGQGSALGKAPSSASAGPSLHTTKVQGLVATRSLTRSHPTAFLVWWNAACRPLAALLLDDTDALLLHTSGS